MGTIKLRLPSWIDKTLSTKTSGWLTLEKEVGADATINDLLDSFVMTHPSFREAVFNPNTGGVNEQLNVIINDKLLTYQEIAHAKLTDGDTGPLGYDARCLLKAYGLG